jgi:hypothetical protein
MKPRQLATTTLVLSVIVLLSSCDPSKALNKAFAKVGLTRLALIRSDIDPGALLVSSGKTAIFADSITDYVPTAKISTVFEDKTREVSGYIPKIEGSSNIEPKVALDLLASLFPLSASADFKFTSNVSIAQMECKIKRFPVPAVTAFLQDPGNSALSASLKPYFEQHSDVYIVYEVWRSSSIDFSSDTGTDITTSVKVNEIKPISKAEGSLVVKRTAKETLKVTGNQPYAFAVKLLKLQRDPQNGNLSAVLTQFTPPDVVKGPDDEYTFVSEDMQGVAVKRVSPLLREQALKAH